MINPLCVNSVPTAPGTVLVTYGGAPHELADGVQGDLLPDLHCCITEPLVSQAVLLCSKFNNTRIFFRSCSVELRSGVHPQPMGDQGASTPA